MSPAERLEAVLLAQSISDPYFRFGELSKLKAAYGASAETITASVPGSIPDSPEVGESGDV